MFGFFTCKCARNKDWVPGCNYDTPFRKMDELDCDTENWVYLKRCPKCGQHWRVDEQPGRDPVICAKIPGPENWKNFDDTAFRRAYLIEQNGGLSENICSWQGCENKTLKGRNLCPDCLFDKLGWNAKER